MWTTENESNLEKRRKRKKKKKCFVVWFCHFQPNDLYRWFVFRFFFIPPMHLYFICFELREAFRFVGCCCCCANDLLLILENRFFFLLLFLSTHFLDSKYLRFVQPFHRRLSWQRRTNFSTISLMCGFFFLSSFRSFLQIQLHSSRFSHILHFTIHSFELFSNVCQTRVVAFDRIFWRRYKIRVHLLLSSLRHKNILRLFNR